MSNISTTDNVSPVTAKTNGDTFGRLHAQQVAEPTESVVNLDALDWRSSDPQTFCDGFQERHGRFNTHKRLPKKEILEYAWRVILGDDYEDVFMVRDDIIEKLSNEYEDSFGNDYEQREERRRFLEKNGLI